eukprot:IDg2279t1
MPLPPACAVSADAVLVFWPLVDDHSARMRRVRARARSRMRRPRCRGRAVRHNLQDGVFLRISAPFAPFADDDASYRSAWEFAQESRDFVPLCSRSNCTKKSLCYCAACV